MVSFLECPVGMSQVSCYHACAISWPVSMRLDPAAHSQGCTSQGELPREKGYRSLAHRYKTTVAREATKLNSFYDSLQGTVTCTSGNSTFMAEAAELTTALGDYQSGRCLELNTSSTVLIKCGCSVYTRGILLDALVRAKSCLLAHALASLYADGDMGNGHSHRVPGSHKRNLESHCWADCLPGTGPSSAIYPSMNVNR